MSKYTQGAFIDSFWMLLEEKSLDKISVKDIIETAQINRNTFYYHFDDISSFYEEYCSRLK